MTELDCDEKGPPSKECQTLFGLITENSDSVKSLTALPSEILYKIFELCPLLDQLALAKVCKLFRQIMRDIYQNKFKHLTYYYQRFVFKYQLEEDKLISEFCDLCGNAVQRMTFVAYGNIDLLTHIPYNWKLPMPTDNLKNYINTNFKENIKYFKNLQELNIHGDFLEDQVILELTKHCRKLKTLRIFDGGYCLCYGHNLEDFEALENLELKSCRHFHPNNVLDLSLKRPLKSISIVECEKMKLVPKLILLCDYWQHLKSLNLTASNSDSKCLKAVINLPALNNLKFHWVGDTKPLGFEEKFFLELRLNKTKSLQLTHIKFENDRYFKEKDYLREWPLESNPAMRESICKYNEAWQWSPDTYREIALHFGSFKNLTELSFIYCRLLDYEQIKHISLVTPKLESIKIYGCPKKEDKQFKLQWLKFSTCQLNFDSFVPFEKLTDLYEKAKEEEYYGKPVLRSIECQFGLNKTC